MWWVVALWLAKSTAEQNCPLDCSCPHPMEINCSSMSLLTLDPSLFSGLGVRQTRHLYLHENRLTTLDRDLLAWLGQLRVLTLHDNLLMTLSSDVFYGQRNLEVLTLHGNALVTLPPNIFASMIALKVLSLASNRFNVIHSEEFVNNILLEVLDLGKNELHSLPEDFLSSNVRLVELKLNDNLLETLPEGCLKPVVKSLKVLDLSGNSLQRLPPLMEMEVLDTLTLSKCNLSDIPKLPMSIRRLDVSYNLLREIPETLPLSLETFNISINHLETIPFVEVYPQNLRNLSLSHNRLRELSPLPSSVQFLWLDHSDLRSPIDENIFAESAQLQYMNMEGNQLTTPLGHNVFRSQTKLNTLVLADNCLATLDPKDFAPLISLRTLNISGNPLHCDCRVKNTREWAMRRKIVVTPEMCDKKQWDEPLGELDCRPTTTTTRPTTTTTRPTTTTTRPTTTTTRRTTTTTTTTSSTTANSEELGPPLSQMKQDSSAPRRRVCSVLVITAVIALEVT